MSLKSKSTITLDHLAEKLAEYWHALEERGAAGIEFRDFQKVIEFFDLVDEVEEKLRRMPHLKRYRVKLRTEAEFELVANSKEMAQQIVLWCQMDSQKRAGITQTGGTTVQATALSKPTKLPNHRKSLKGRSRGDKSKR